MERIKIKGELITFQNTTGFHHDGVLYESENSKKTIIHVHGSYGNFYQSPFVRVMAKAYVENGYNFLSFNLRCHDGFAEGYKNENDFEYVGGALTDWATCVSDIESAVQFAITFSDRIIIQGHSLGCDRTVEYLLKSNKDFDFILLSPCDSYQLQSKWLQPDETVEQQTKRLKIGQTTLNNFDWLPINEYGVYSMKEDYILPITRKALLSIISGPPFKLFKISDPVHYYLNQNCFIYIGGKDNLQTEKPMMMFDFFKERIKNVESCLVEDGDHMLKNYEEKVAKKIIMWLKTLNS